MANSLNFHDPDFVTVYCRRNSHGAPDTRTEELKSERDKVNTLLTRLESQENALASERQQHQATRETLQQRLEQAVADAQARAGELALERDRVSSLTARLESQEKASSEQLVRMGSEIASLTDRCTQLENQRDDARLETMGEKGEHKKTWGNHRMSLSLGIK